MPDTALSLPVTGTVKRQPGGTMLVLSERLIGVDTYKVGRLQIGDAPPSPVRILTFDDTTVLRFRGAPPDILGEAWSGILHLPRGERKPAIPKDLATAAANAGRNLAVLDGAELRYALTFLGEASTDAIRQARIASIVEALPEPAR